MHVHARRFRASALFLIGLLACTAGFSAPKKPAQPPVPAGNRFLFVVETSLAMQAFEHAGRQAVFDLVYSGIDKQVQKGDTVGLWNFGEEVHGGIFPMQMWEPEQALQLASLMGLFLKNQRYENVGRLDHVIPKLLALIKTVEDVNVLVISTPEHTWRGTAFDAEINLASQNKAGDGRMEKSPLITTLVARKGAIISWSVTLAGEAISLPKPSDKSVQAGSAQPPKDQSGKESPAPVSAPVKRIVITSKPAATNSGVTPGDVQIVVSNQVAAANALQPQAGATAAAPPNAKTESAVVNASPSLPAADPRGGEPGMKPPAKPFPLGLEPLAAAARERTSATNTNTSTPTQDASGLALATPQTFFTPRNLFILGAAFMVIALILLFLAFRFYRQAPKPSFITRSFEREKP